MSALYAVLLGCMMSAQLTFRAEMTTFACKDKDFMEDYADAIMDRDTEAMRAAVATVARVAVLGDACVLVREGQQVTVTDVGFISPLHEIRVRGKLGHYYVIGAMFENVR